MEWLRRLWRWLQGRPADQPGAPAASHAPGRPGRRRVEDYTNLLEGHPGARVTTVRVLGGRATDDGVLFEREHLETEDDQGNARQVDVFGARLCHAGHLLDQTVRATAVCALCGDLMCSTEGCTGWCAFCGAACCAKDRVSYTLHNGNTITYCSQCRWRHWWRLWWGAYP